MSLESAIKTEAKPHQSHRRQASAGCHLFPASLLLHNAPTEAVNTDLTEFQGRYKTHGISSTNLQEM